MTLKELKEGILNKNISSNFFIFKYEEPKFLVKEYIDALSELLKLEIRYLDNIDEVYETNNDFFNVEVSTLNVLFIDELSNELPELANTIICCNRIDKNLINDLSKYVVEFPKLENWQIEDYVKTKLQGLDKEVSNWLCEITNYDIDRLNNEIDKLIIFDEKDRKKIFISINNDCGYSDLNNFNIFNLINAIVKKDRPTISNILKDIDSLDVEPMGLVSLLIRQFRSVIEIQLGNNVSADKLNMSPKQFNAIKYNCGKYSNNKLIEIYETLASIDYKLKSGLIDNDKIINYVICNILK